MLQTKQLEKLLDILSVKEQTLDEIEGQFLTSFSESLSVFNASFALSNLLNLNLLSSQQRIVALFLLIENFKSEGFKRHPFGATILNISLRTTEAYERRMIADLVLDSKRDKYSKFKIEALFDEEQVLIEMMEERPEIKKLRDEFIAALPKVSQAKRSEVHAVVSDFNERDKKYFAPETEVSRASIRSQEVSNEGFNVGFMRPVPAFLPVSAAEFNWLSPGIVVDVHWDNTAEIEKKLQKCRQIINKGLDHHLSKDEATEIDRSLEIEPYAVLSLNISCENLNLLIKNNPFVAVSFLVKMANYPLIADYLESILASPISLNSIDVVSRLTKAARIPSEYLETYTLKNMKEAIGIPENHKDRAKMSRVIATFIRSLMKNKVLDISKYEEELTDFMNAFVEIEEIQALRKLLLKTE